MIKRCRSKTALRVFALRTTDWMLAASTDTDIPFIFSEPQLTISFEGNALSGNGEKCIGSKNQCRCDCRDCGACNHMNVCPQLATSSHGIPHYYRSASWGKRYFISLSGDRRVKMPGRGLEPLRIAPPDPKSGASANFATLATCDVSKVALLSASGKLRL